MSRNRFENGFNPGTLPSDPSDGVVGDVYYNATNNKIREYVNGSWRDAVQADLIQALSNKQINYSSVTDSITTGSSATIQTFTTGIVRLTNASLTSISGIPAGTSGQFLLLENKNISIFIGVLIL